MQSKGSAKRERGAPLASRLLKILCTCVSPASQSPLPKLETTRSLIDPVDQQTNVVYKIPCADCPWSYIGETGRCLKTRVKEHTRNTKAFKKGSNVATHAWLNDHSIDFKSAHVINKDV